jgi:hypothetical protein
MAKLYADEFQRFVELLQIVDQQMSPRPIDRLDLADDPFLEIETALPPPENLRYGCFTLERIKYGVSYRPLLQINFAVPATGLKCKASAALTQAAHLQDFRSGKLIEIADERVAGIDSFGRLRGRTFEGTDKASNLAIEPSLASGGKDNLQLLLRSQRHRFLFVARWHEANDLQGRKMLARIRGLLDRERGLPFHDKSVKILPQQNSDRLGKRSHDTGFNPVHPVEEAKGPVLKDRIGV